MLWSEGRQLLEGSDEGTSVGTSNNLCPGQGNQAKVITQVRQGQPQIILSTCMSSIVIVFGGELSALPVPYQPPSIAKFELLRAQRIVLPVLLTQDVRSQDDRYTDRKKCINYYILKAQSRGINQCSIINHEIRPCRSLHILMLILLLLLLIIL